MKYLLDTDHISIMQRQTGVGFTKLMNRIAQHPLTDLGFSIISFHEQVLGCHAYVNRARNSEDVIRGYGMFARVLKDFVTAPVVPFDANAAKVFERLQSQRIRVATMDLRIASIALSRGLILVSRNIRDFGQVPGLQIEDWTA